LGGKGGRAAEARAIAWARARARLRLLDGGDAAESQVAPPTEQAAGPRAEVVCAQPPGAHPLCGSDEAAPRIPRAHFAPYRYCERSPTAGCHELSGGGGVPRADFVLYVTAIQTARCGNAGRAARGAADSAHQTHTAAYAGSCARDQFDRPVAGAANFCPSQLSNATARWETQLATAIHEIGHALGFAADHLAFFRDAEAGGRPRTPRLPQDGMPPLTPPPPICNGRKQGGGDGRSGGGDRGKGRAAKTKAPLLRLPSNSTLLLLPATGTAAAAATLASFEADVSRARALIESPASERERARLAELEARVEYARRAYGGAAGGGGSSGAAAAAAAVTVEPGDAMPRPLLVTPAVRRAARRQFGCAHLLGAELQSQQYRVFVGGGSSGGGGGGSGGGGGGGGAGGGGGSGSARAPPMTDDGRASCWGSHWSERLFHNELMSPIMTHAVVYSAVTLALFEDSGWYVPDYTARLVFSPTDTCSPTPPL
jgi:hypothetical protein